MPYNLAAESFHIKNCSRLLREEPIFIWKTKEIRFWGPLCGLGATYAVYLRLIGKLVVDLNFVTIHAFVRQKANRQTDTHRKNSPALLQRCKNAAVCDGAISRFWRRYDIDIFALKISVLRHDIHCMSAISILSLVLMISMSKLFSGDFNSLILVNSINFSPGLPPPGHRPFHSGYVHYFDRIFSRSLIYTTLH